MLFPYGPIQFTDGGLNFFRGWLCDLLPGVLCLLFLKFDFSIDSSIKLPVKIFLILIASVFLVVALVDAARGMPAAISEDRNIFCQPDVEMRFGTKIVATYKAYDLVHEYLEVRQEWALLPGLRMVRYIDRLAESPSLKISQLNSNEIHYEGNPLLLHDTRPLW